jgi:hypothetical protein
MEIIYPVGYPRSEADEKFEHTHTGTSGINIYGDSDNIIIDGQDLIYDFQGDGQITTDLTGHVWSITYSGTNNAIGWNYFTGHSGTSVDHFLNNINHTMHITPGGDTTLTIDQMAAIGDVYVDRGVNQDTIFSTGSGSNGIGFSWYAVVSGTHAVYTAPPSPNRLACAYCQDDNLIITQTIKDDPFGHTLLGPTLDYVPPNIKTTNSTTLFIPKGRYYALGPRLDSQYLDLSNRHNYWDVSSHLTIDIHTTITGSSSSTTSGWYSVYLTGDTSNDVEILPMVRVYGGDYNETYVNKTTISGGKHDEPTAAESVFIVDYDTFNDYRLIKVDTDETVGTVMTIEGTVDSPDRFVVDGDHFGGGASLEQGDFLLLVPPVSVPSLYLGSLRIKEDLEVLEFKRKKWNYQLTERLSIDAVSNTSPGNTSLVFYVSPLAQFFSSQAYVSSTTTAANGAAISFYDGESGSDYWEQNMISSDVATVNNFRHAMVMRGVALSSISMIRNNGVVYNGGAWVAAGLTVLYITGFEE